jgi:4-hydroxy-3-methylbut-2-enyl diphosphate reductase
LKYSHEGRECILIGHAGHPEVEGTMGRYDTTRGGVIYLIEDIEQAKKIVVKNPQQLSFVTQTTLSMDDTAAVIDALRERFPNIEGPRKDDICYATQNRQDAIRELAQQCDLVLVVGSQNSSNSNRLQELAERMGSAAYLIDSAEQIEAAWLIGKKAIGVSAGASAPEILVEQVTQRLHDLGAAVAINMNGKPENVTFTLPKELRIPAQNL